MLNLRLVNTVGVLALIWAALVLVAVFAGPPPDPAAIAITLVIVLAVGAYGLALLNRHPRAVVLGWVLTGLFGLAALARGLAPIVLIPFVLFLAFSIYLQTHRGELVSK